MWNIIKATLPWIALACLPEAAIQAQTISSLNPASATAGGPAFTLTISGVGFNDYYGPPRVTWITQILSSALSNDFQQITAAVPATLIASPVVADAQVFIATFSVSTAVTAPTYIGSNIVHFTVTPSSSSTPFTLSLTAVSFQFSPGDKGGQTKPVLVGSKTGAATSFGAGVSYPSTPPVNWLSVNPTSGVTPATLNLTVSPSGL